jgi:AcrR family transcriptional regulator
MNTKTKTALLHDRNPATENPAAEDFKPIELTPTLRLAAKLEREASGRAFGAEPSSRERILDAAEALFGVDGPDVVSLRDISALSGAATGLIHYHFPAKESLLEEVVARRATIVSEIRRAELARLGDNPTVPALLDAFVRPLVELADGPDRGWASYCRLISLIASSDARGALIAKHLDETAKLYVAALKKSAPAADETDVLYGFGFTVILMANTIVKNQRLQTMSDGKVQTADITGVYLRMMDYCVAGMNALIAAKG